MNLSFPLLTADEGVGLNETLSALADGAAHALGPNLLGIYLVGSFALDAGDSQSDVDFAVVTNRQVAPAELRHLLVLHAGLPDRGTFGADHLEGSYLPSSDLADIGAAEWLYVDNGSSVLAPSTHDNSLAFRWVLRERGKTLFGPSPETLVPPVDPHQLKHEARSRAFALRDLLRSDPAIVDDSWVQTHFVTALCRFLFTHEKGAIVSKAHATRWVGDRLEPRWRELLERALADRPTTWERVGGTAHPQMASMTVALAEEITAAMSA